MERGTDLIGSCLLDPADDSLTRVRNSEDTVQSVLVTDVIVLEVNFRFGMLG